MDIQAPARVGPSTPAIDLPAPLAIQMDQHPSPASVRTMLGILWRGRLVIAGCSLALATALYCGSQALPRQYTASALVAVETQRFAIPELQGAISGDAASDPMPLVRSEVQVLRSRALLQAVVDRLGLADDPEFNPILQGPSLRERLKRSVAGLLSGSGAASAADTAPTNAEIRDAVLGTVAKGLAVNNDNRSLMITIEFRSESPEQAAAVANTLVEIYAARKSESRRTTNREANAALVARVEDARRELNAVENEVEKVRAQHQHVVLRSGSINHQRIEELAAAQTRAGTERVEAEAALRRARAGGGAESADVLTSATIARLRENETTAARRASELAATLGPAHPDRLAAEGDLGAARRAIAAETVRVVAALQSRVTSTREREREISRTLRVERDEATRTGAVQAELVRLEREAETRRALYTQLLERAEQTSVDPRGPQPVGARIISAAEAPGYPSSPKPLLAGLVGLGGGAALGGLLTILGLGQAGARRPGSRPATAAGLSVAAVLAPRPGHQRNTLPAAVLTDHLDPAAETLREAQLRLRLKAGPAARVLAVVATGSARAGGEVAAAIARTAAIDGLKTLLVEADLRTPCFASLLGLNAAGLPPMGSLFNDVAVQDKRAAEAGQGACTVVSPIAPHRAPQSILGAPWFAAALRMAAEHYDLVIVGAPSVAAGSDALALASLADATLVVIDGSTSEQPAILEAASAIRAVGRGPTLGLLDDSRRRG